MQTSFEIGCRQQGERTREVDGRTTVPTSGEHVVTQNTLTEPAVFYHSSVDRCNATLKSASAAIKINFNEKVSDVHHCSDPRYVWAKE